MMACIPYLAAIVNHSRAISRLFEMGMHLQMEILMRSQFEYINLVYCMIKSESFFERMIIENDSGRFHVKPTSSLTKKEMLKLGFDKESKKAFEYYFVLLNDIFSEAAHGHAGHVFEALRPIQGINEPDSILDDPIGGNKLPSASTKFVLIKMNNYTQILFLSIANFFITKGVVSEPQGKEFSNTSCLHLLDDDGTKLTVEEMMEGG